MQNEQQSIGQLLMTCFEKGHVNRDTINLTLTAYNISCAEMRSEERDSYMQVPICATCLCGYWAASAGNGIFD